VNSTEFRLQNVLVNSWPVSAGRTRERGRPLLVRRYDIVIHFIFLVCDWAPPHRTRNVDHHRSPAVLYPLIMLESLPIAIPIDQDLSVRHPLGVVPTRVQLHEGISLDESYHLIMQTSLLSLGGPSSKKICGVAYVKATDEKTSPRSSLPGSTKGGRGKRNISEQTCTHL